MSRWNRRLKRGSCALSVSPAFLLLLFLFAAIDEQHLLLPLLLAAAIHEGGHILVLRLCGGQIEALRITAMGAELRIHHSERLSYGREIAAVLAGPCSNLLAMYVLAALAVQWNWENGFLYAGLHGALALFNLLPVRMLDGGRSLYLLLSWKTEPITAARVMRAVSCLCLSILLALGAALQLVIGIQLPLLLLEGWLFAGWLRETGIVKCRGKG